MKTRFRFATLLLFAMANILLAQSDNPTSGSAAAPSDPVTQSEDIPPPEPMPASEPVAAPQGTTPVVSGGEMRAYNFGVSYVPTNAGLEVKGVIVGSPAQAAGVRPNDTIVSVNGQPVEGQQSLDSGIAQTVGVMRNGQVQSLTVGGHTTGVTTQRAIATPAPPSATYAVPKTTYSAPQSYRYAPAYNTYRSVPNYSYRSASPYYNRGYSYRSYNRPSVTIGLGIGSSGYGRGYGYPGMRYGGYGRGPGYGYGRGYGGYGRGYGGYGGYGRGYGGRSGVGISIGGIGIRF